MKNLNDEQLVGEFLKNNKETALEELVGRYLPLIFGYVRKYTGSQDNASDITQEVFVKAWKNLKRFDTSKSFRTWIFTIAKRTSIDWLRQKGELRLEDGFDKADDAPSVLDYLMEREVSDELNLAMSRIPVSYSTIVDLYIKEGLNFREISEKLSEPLNTIKSRYRRGISLLKKLI